MCCGWRAITCFSMTPRPGAILPTSHGHIRRPLPTRSPGSVTQDTWLTGGSFRIAVQRKIRTMCQRDDGWSNHGGELAGVEPGASMLCAVHAVQRDPRSADAQKVAAWLKSIQTKEWPNSSPNRQESVGSLGRRIDVLHRGVKLTTLSRTGVSMAHTGLAAGGSVTASNSIPAALRRSRQA